METINIKQLTFKNETIQESFNTMLNNGFRVFVYNTDMVQDCKYSKDGKLAYLQAGYWGGIQISTVHVPNKEIGTGFGQIHGTKFEPIYDPTLEQLTDGFMIAPKWAKQSDIAKVKKYSLDNWIEKESQKTLKYKEVIL